MADQSKKKPGPLAKVGGVFKKIGKFFRDVVSEMKKVAWPSKKQIINNTLIVLSVVLIAAVFIFGLDSLFGFILRLVLQTA